MDGGELVMSAGVLNRIFVFLLYFPVCLFSFWLLLPRLSSTSKRLAIGMLAVQVLIIVLAQVIQPNSLVEEWLWNVDKEWNIPSFVESTQLILVGGVALATAWLARAKPAWQRLYLFGVALVFLLIGHDEFFSWKLFASDWKRRYMIIGAVTVVATLLTALLSPSHTWKWHLCLLIGLSLIAIGGIEFDAVPNNCRNLGFVRIDGCLNFATLEEVTELVGGWLALVAVLGHFADAVPTPSLGIRRTLYVFPVLWILLLVLVNPVRSLEIQLPAEPAAVQFESGVRLYGYEMKSDGLPSSGFMYVPEDEIASGLGFSIHLVDQASRDSIAGRNEHLHRRFDVQLAPGYGYVYRQMMEIEVPSLAPVNRALWVVLTIWRKRGGDYEYQSILASDHNQLSDTQVVLDELVLPADSAASSTIPLAEFENGFILEAVALPERAQAGETLSIPFAWRSDEDGQEGHAQFLHLGHEESGDWWVYDQQPLGDRLPTRLWYAGLADSEVWQVPLPADLEPGRYNVFTGLYRRRDLERVPAKDADGVAWVDGRVLLGSLILECNCQWAHGMSP